MKPDALDDGEKPDALAVVRPLFEMSADGTV